MKITEGGLISLGNQNSDKKKLEWNCCLQTSERNVSGHINLIEKQHDSVSLQKSLLEIMMIIILFAKIYTCCDLSN